MSEEWIDTIKITLAPFLQFKTDEEILAALVPGTELWAIHSMYGKPEAVERLGVVSAAPHMCDILADSIVIPLKECDRVFSSVHLKDINGHYSAGCSCFTTRELAEKYLEEATALYARTPAWQHSVQKFKTMCDEMDEYLYAYDDLYPDFDDEDDTDTLAVDDDISEFIVDDKLTPEEASVNTSAVVYADVDQGPTTLGTIISAALLKSTKSAS